MKRGKTKKVRCKGLQPFDILRVVVPYDFSAAAFCITGKNILVEKQLGIGSRFYKNIVLGGRVRLSNREIVLLSESPKMVRLQNMEGNITMKKVKYVTDRAFLKYGTIQMGYAVTHLMQLSESIFMPQAGINYEASIEMLEQTEDFMQIVSKYAGGKKMQCGLCWGQNDRMDALEYHRSNELNIAVTDIVVMLGDIRDIEKGFRYNSKKAEIFYVPKGTAIELYSTTLHYAPCSATPEGFRAIVCLPEGTNAPLSDREERLVKSSQGEAQLLCGKDKWVLYHPDAANARSGKGYVGIYEENLRYTPK